MNLESLSRRHDEFESAGEHEDILKDRSVVPIVREIRWTLLELNGYRIDQEALRD